MQFKDIRVVGEIFQSQVCDYFIDAAVVIFWLSNGMRLFL